RPVDMRKGIDGLYSASVCPNGNSPTGVTIPGKGGHNVPESTLTFSLSHFLTFSLSHSLTLSLSHCLTLSLSRCLTLSLSLSLTLSLSHCLAVSLSHLERIPETKITDLEKLLPVHKV